MDGYYDRAGVDCFDRVGEGKVAVAVDLIYEALAELDLWREDKIGVVELKAPADLIARIEGFHLQEFVGLAGARIGSQVIVDLATDDCIEAEVSPTFTFDLELEREGEIDALNSALFDAIPHWGIEVELLFCELEGGSRTEINPLVELEITHEAEGKTGSPVGLDGFEGIGLGICFCIADAILRHIKSEGETEVVRLLIVVRHILHPVLSEAGRS